MNLGKSGLIWRPLNLSGLSGLSWTTYIICYCLSTLFKFLGAKLFTKTSWDIKTYSSKLILLSPFLSPIPINPSTRFSSCFWLKFSMLMSSLILLASNSSSFVKKSLLSVLISRNASCSEYQGCFSCSLKKMIWHD